MTRDEARERIRRYLSYNGDCPLLVQHHDESFPSDTELEAVADAILDLIKFPPRDVAERLRHPTSGWGNF